MSKAKYITVVLVLSLCLMGAGYAAWSETVTINNTAETGNLTVEFVQTAIWPYIADFQQMSTMPYNVPSPIVNSEIIHGAKVTTVNIDHMFPGSWTVFEARIENLGTIPAKGDNIEVIFSPGSSQYLKEQMIVMGEIQHFTPDSSVPGGFKLVNSSGFLYAQLKDLGLCLNNAISGWEVKPGDIITFDVSDETRSKIAEKIPGYDETLQNSLYFWLPSTADNNTENQSVKFTIHLNFKQFNN
ncbi:hypothetical protein [Phosphitispora sp. TUW77]|uniref:hypothetical protein n=1 Tax=Phosphitispora sp. TUW77 TaxID=3152361 RepID=UPI003AB35D69